MGIRKVPSVSPWNPLMLDPLEFMSSVLRELDDELLEEEPELLEFMSSVLRELSELLDHMNSVDSLDPLEEDP